MYSSYQSTTTPMVHTSVAVPSQQWRTPIPTLAPTTPTVLLRSDSGAPLAYSDQTGQFVPVTQQQARHFGVESFEGATPRALLPAAVTESDRMFGGDNAKFVTCAGQCGGPGLQQNNLRYIHPVTASMPSVNLASNARSAYATMWRPLDSKYML